jgi:uncharacterized repeat protein (TIGR03803 family)
MPNKKCSVAFTAILAIFTATLFMPTTRADAQEKVLHSFNPSAGDGSTPVGGLIFDAAGSLYGTTDKGGAYGYGSVFELSPASGGGWTEKLLHSFNQDGTDGIFPQSTLILDAAGNLYGTTYMGGVNGTSGGTVFELSPGAGGTWTEKILHQFGNPGDGVNPQSGLISDAGGNLYGTTLDGGVFSVFGGTVFELSPATGGGWTEKVLHSFGKGKDGQYPSGSLIFDASGNLYGLANQGGADTYYGTVFELTPLAGGAWVEKILHSFNVLHQGEGGQNPVGGLIFDAAGNLYGMTDLGGVCSNCFSAGGTAFKFSPSVSGGWDEKILHTFNPYTADGSYPVSGLIIDPSGNLYGTTPAGGSHATTLTGGTVFELKPQAGGGWAEKILHNFGKGTDGGIPFSGLIFDAAGNLYGTTQQGGAYGYGTVFEITP